MPLSPSFTLGLMVATLCGAFAHLVFGGGGRPLLMLVISAWVGFGLGQAVGEIMSITPITLGSTHLLSGLLGALLAIITAQVFIQRRRHR